MVQSMVEGLGGVLEGHFTPLIFANSVGTCVQCCHMQYILSGSGSEEQTGAYERDDPRVTFLMNSHSTH